MRKTLLAMTVGCLISSFNGMATIHNIDVGNGGNNFAPSSVTSVILGDTILWTAKGSGHDVVSGTIPATATTFNSGFPMASTFRYIPNVVGTYNYYCSPHVSVGMTGSFVVANCTNPNAATITSANGSAACAGGNAIQLSTTAQAGATYEWFLGTTKVTGATSASLNVVATAANAGSYTVKVTRCANTVTSTAFNVTINALPTPTFTETHTGLAYTFTNTTPSPASHTYQWTFSDGSPMQTTTNATRTFTTPGSKTVTLKATTTSTGCNASKPETYNAILGVGTLAGESYSILPNPAADVLRLTLPLDAKIRLSNMNGQTLEVPVTVNGRTRQLDVRSLPEGMYLLLIATQKASVTEQITVKH